MLLSIAGGSDLGLFEINEAAALVSQAAHAEANIIFGAVIDDALGDEVRVTVIAAGFDGGMPKRRDEGTVLRRRPRRSRRRRRPAASRSRSATSAAGLRQSRDDRAAGRADRAGTSAAAGPGGAQQPSRRPSRRASRGRCSSTTTTSTCPTS